jgi:sugar lactone lactonase YvrE
MRHFPAYPLLAVIATFPLRTQPSQILVPGQTWTLLGQGYQLTADSAVDKDGSVYFSDAHNNRIMKIDLEGRISTWTEDSHGTHGVAFGPDGRLYASQHDRKRIVAFSRDGAESVVAEGMQTHHFTVTSGNRIYFSDAPGHKVWTVEAGHARVVSDAVDWPRGMRVSPDRSTLAVNAPRTEWVWQFRIQPDGSLTAGHPFCQLKTPSGSSASDAGGMAFDSEGLLYVATNTGVQVCDSGGRVTGAIDTPGAEGASNLWFAGPGLQWLYVTDGDKLYRRPVKRHGAPEF